MKYFENDNLDIFAKIFNRILTRECENPTATRFEPLETGLVMQSLSFIETLGELLILLGGLTLEQQGLLKKLFGILRPQLDVDELFHICNTDMKKQFEHGEEHPMFKLLNLLLEEPSPKKAEETESGFEW